MHLSIGIDFSINFNLITLPVSEKRDLKWRTDEQTDNKVIPYISFCILIEVRNPKTEHLQFVIPVCQYVTAIFFQQLLTIRKCNWISSQNVDFVRRGSRLVGARLLNRFSPLRQPHAAIRSHTYLHCLDQTNSKCSLRDSHYNKISNNK